MLGGILKALLHELFDRKARTSGKNSLKDYLREYPEVDQSLIPEEAFKEISDDAYQAATAVSQLTRNSIADEYSKFLAVYALHMNNLLKGCEKNLEDEIPRFVRGVFIRHQIKMHEVNEL